MQFSSGNMHDMKPCVIYNNFYLYAKTGGTSTFFHPSACAIFGRSGKNASASTAN